MALWQRNDGHLLRSLSRRSSGGTGAASDITSGTRPMTRGMKMAGGLSPAAPSDALVALLLLCGVVPGVRRFGPFQFGKPFPLRIGVLHRAFLAPADLRHLPVFVLAFVV